MRCWTRKFWTVLRQHIVCDCKVREDGVLRPLRVDEPCPKGHKVMERFVNRVLLCGLLGNYEHANRHRPMDPVQRKWLYERLDAHRHRTTYDQHKEFRDGLVERVPRIYLHALQEYVCVSIYSEPILLRHIRHVHPKFDKFFEAVSGIMTRIRKCFWAFAKPLTERLEAIDAEIAAGKPQVLAASYDKPPVPFFDFLREVRSAARPSAALWFAKQGLNPQEYELAEFRCLSHVKPSTEISSRITKALDKEKKQKAPDDGGSDSENDEDEKQKKKKMRDEGDPTAMKNLISQAVQDGFARSVSQLAVFPPPSKPGIKQLRITSMHILVEHSMALSKICKAIDIQRYTSDAIFDIFTSCLQPLFECSKQAVDELQGMVVDYRLVKRAKDAWKLRMQQFNECHPYAYALLQVRYCFFSFFNFAFDCRRFANS